MTLSGGLRTDYYANRGQAANTLFDGRLFESSTPPGPHVGSAQAVNICSLQDGIAWYGGFTYHDSDALRHGPDFAHEDYYHSSLDGGPYAHQCMTIGRGTKNATPSDISGGRRHRAIAFRTDNAWDSLQTSFGEEFHISGCYATHNHDDFLENDNFCSGTLEDCLVDGTFVFYSQRSGGRNGKPEDKVVTIQNNLVRLKNFNVTGTSTSQRGAGYIFKTHGGYTGSPGKHCKLRILNNIFLVEAQNIRPDFGDRMNELLGFPYVGGMIIECSGNIVIWDPLEGGPSTFPGSVPPSGVTVFNGSEYRQLWQARRNAWLASHQEVDQRPSVSAT